MLKTGWHFLLMDLGSTLYFLRFFRMVMILFTLLSGEEKRGVILFSPGVYGVTIRIALK